MPMRFGPAACACVVFVIVSAAATASAAEDGVLRPLEPGDRVLFVGNTLIERAQLYDFVELAMTTRFPGVTYRNLGWSGDTVYGEARAYFGSPEDGFNHLKEHVHALEPTVIFVGYGLNESYRGEEGLEAFERGLGRLLDMLEETGARLVLLSPLPHEQATSPLPDVSEANANIRLYSESLAEAAESRGHGYVDLYRLMREMEVTPDRPLMSNGLHLTAFGYFHLAAALEEGLGWPTREWRVEMHASGRRPPVTRGVEWIDAALDRDGLRFRLQDHVLPLDMPEHVDATHSSYAPPRVLQVSGLGRGEERYELRIDGESVVTATAEEWSQGVALYSGGAFEQAARLREEILVKNEFFFHQFRPQNETYIRGFRDHEQGRHVEDLPRFDPLIEEREAEIEALREPATHTYEIERVD